jgi:hypothetical protein
MDCKVLAMQFYEIGKVLMDVGTFYKQKITISSC